MTEKMKAKIQAAREMMMTKFGDVLFIPEMYKDSRYGWKDETPTWETLKKYANEAGLKSKEVEVVWHSDGSALAAMSGLIDGVSTYTILCYYFE